MVYAAEVVNVNKLLEAATFPLNHVVLVTRENQADREQIGET